MKKQSLLFVAGAMLALASCQNEGANTGGFTQEQVDSIVNARVNEQMMQQQAMNDSIINAMAAYKADSIVAAMKGGSVTTRTTTTKTTTVKPTTPEKQEPATVGNGKPKMGDKANSNEVGNGKPKMGDKKEESTTIGNGKPKMGGNK